MAVGATGAGRIVTDEAMGFVPWVPTPQQEQELLMVAQAPEGALLADLKNALDCQARPEDPGWQVPFSTTVWCRYILQRLTRGGRL